MDTELWSKKKIIYELMVGAWDTEFYPVPESEIVENEYAEGTECEQLYQEVYDAGQRLCRRLGVVDEDVDVCTIVNNLLKIGEIQGLKMYDYGAMFGYDDEPGRD